MARSKKDVSNVVSGAGLLTRIFTDLDKQLRQQGGTDADWHRLTTPEGEQTICAMVDAMLDRADFGQLRFKAITVDYGRTLAEMIAAGHYDWVNDDITKDHFPVTGSGQVELQPVLVHLDRYAYTREVEAEMERRGLRAGTHQELLAFGKQYPELQREFPIVGLGSAWVNPHGNRHVVYLWGAVDRRRLNLYWDDPGSQWDSRCRFLAFSK